MEMTRDLDLAGAHMLGELHEELEQMGICLRLSRVQLPARSLLDRLGITEKIGEENFHPRTLFAVAHYLSQEGLGRRVSADILPDMVKCVHDMVCDRADRVGGKERDHLENIRREFETIIEELSKISKKES
jgi:hypothetical protein